MRARARSCSRAAGPRPTTWPCSARSGAMAAPPCARPPSTTPCCTRSSTWAAGSWPSTRPARRPRRAGRRARRPTSASCRSWLSTTRSARSPRSPRWPPSCASGRPRARAPHRRRAGPPWLDLAARPRTRPGRVSRPQVRRPEGRRCAPGAGQHAVEPLLMGGGQERDRRSGTHNVAGIVAMAEAMRVDRRERGRRGRAWAPLRDRLVDGLVARSPGLRRDRARAIGRWPARPTSASRASRTRRCCSCSTRRASAPRPRRRARSGAMDPSHVLAAMGVPRGWPAARCACRSATDVDRGRGRLAVLDAPTARSPAVREVPAGDARWRA